MIEIDLPEPTASAAREAGLLTSAAMARLPNAEIRRRQAGQSNHSLAGEIAAAGLPDMSIAEIKADVEAARAERRSRTKFQLSCL